MRVGPRYVDGCPNWQLLDARLREAFDRLGEHPPVIHELVETSDDAARLEFRGSPTLPWMERIRSPTRGDRSACHVGSTSRNRAHRARS